MSHSIQSKTSQSSFAPSSTSTSQLHHHHHTGPTRLVRRNSSRHTRGSTLGLIDAARVRLSKDFPALLRSSSLSSRGGTLLPPEVEDSDDQKSDSLDYANGPLSSRSVGFSVESMESRREDRPGRSLGSRIVDFLSRSRSRSRSKKRRSQSLDDAPISEMPTAVHTGSLGRRHVRHASSNDEYLSGSSSTSKPATRLQSRPLSSTTTATNTTIKPRPKKPPELKSVVNAPDHHVHIQTEILPLQATASNSSRKGKRLNIFSMAIPAAMKSPIGDHKSPKGSRPSSPAPERGGWTERFRSGSSSSQVGNKSSGKRDVSNGSRTSRITPPPHAASAHVSTPPPHPRGEYYRRGYSSEPEDEDRGGRCSPLCGLPSPTMATGGIREKGKEKEGLQRLKDREYDAERDRSKEKGKERITGPRRVGSPILKERERDSRTTINAVPMEKTTSGSGNSRRSSRDPAVVSTPTAAVAAMKAKRTKHGSFDFERPVSATHGPVHVRTALRGMGVGSSTVPMQRSTSLKVTSRTSASQADHSRARTHAQPSGRPQPDSFGRSRKPQLDVKTSTAPTRRGTDSSVGSTNPPSNSGTSRNHVNFAEPETPVSSQSGGGSWGKSTGKHVLRGSHGAFKFEPAVPPIPGSPADDRKASAARGEPKLPTPPSKLRQERAAPRTGRSLDLNLGLSWAPSKVKEEAVLLYGGRKPSASSTGSTGRARARWKSGWVDEEGRLGSSTSRPAGSDVADAFEEALGPAAYSTFKTYVHRFDAHAIPLDGPYGLISHARRLLDASSSLDERRKQTLLDRFIRFVQNNQ